jgi:hypothetical protein
MEEEAGAADRQLLQRQRRAHHLQRLVGKQGLGVAGGVDEAAHHA